MIWFDARVGFVLLLSLSLGHASNAWGGDIGWAGTLVLIDSDSGTGAYTGGVEGSTMFSGSLHFPNTCGPTCTLEPFPAFSMNYVFSDGAGSVSGLGATSLGIESSVEIINEEVVNQERIDFAEVFGLTLTLGQTIDTWAVDSQTAGEFAPGFVAWGLSYVNVTSDPFINTNFTSTPPPNPDLIIWQVVEEDGDAYAVLGEVDAVPEPGVSAMLAAGMVTLWGLSVRSRRGRKAGAF